MAKKPFSRASSKAKAATPELRLILCQDSGGMHKRAEEIESLLQEQGHAVTFERTHDHDDLMRLLNKTKDKKAPDAFFMDVGGVGEETATAVIKWFKKNYPGQKLPVFNFASLSTSMSISEAGALYTSQENVETGYVDSDEFIWAASLLRKKLTNVDDGRSNRKPPVSTTLRTYLNEKFKTDLSLEHDDSAYKEEIESMYRVTTARLCQAWRRGRVPAEEAAERLRGYVQKLTTALQKGYYTEGGHSHHGIQKDASFYASAGFPVKGVAVFSVEDAQRKYKQGETPILVMQGYDPEVASLLGKDVLGGLIVTSPYMASHLKLLCETNMVSGLFGLMPQGNKSTAAEFNEEAKPELPPYFAAKQATIHGAVIKSGQEIMVGFEGNGLVLSPPEHFSAKSLSFDALHDNDHLRHDTKNLTVISTTMGKLLKQDKIPFPGVKANLEKYQHLGLPLNGIGLIRTEQMSAANAGQMAEVKKIILDVRPPAAAYQRLKDSLIHDYTSMVELGGENFPVKIRLYDFVQPEILTQDERKSFAKKYSKNELHGGEALATWPALYRTQIAAIMVALHQTPESPWDPPRARLEIMMPAVKTREDALAIKTMVDDEASKAGVSKNQYSFGVMVETLEACQNIQEIVPLCDFISFGTNDLTQQHFAISRSDLKAQARFEEEHGYNPFKTLAPEILGLVAETCKKGRRAKSKLKIDVCGAQAADVATAMNLFDAGVQNVSVAATVANVYALPVLLRYEAYDRARAANPAARKKPSQKKTPGKNAT